MRFGLPDQALDQIRDCFTAYPDIQWVKIYGSRAMNTYHPGSDIDLAFSGPVDHSIRLSSDLENLPTPYLFDITYYDGLQNESLRSHIDRLGQLLLVKDKPELAQ